MQGSLGDRLNLYCAIEAHSSIAVGFFIYLT